VVNFSFSYIFHSLKCSSKIVCVSKKHYFIPLVKIFSVSGVRTVGRLWLLLAYHFSNGRFMLTLKTSDTEYIYTYICMYVYIYIYIYIYFFMCGHPTHCVSTCCLYVTENTEFDKIPVN